MKYRVICVILGIIFIVPLNALAADTNYRFTGKPLDINTNLYYYGQGYYDPNIGRFTQPDPVLNELFDPQTLNQKTGKDLEQFLMDPQNLNPYSYTRNNPIKYVDPTGEYTQEAYQNHSMAVRSWKNVAVGLKLVGWNVSSYFLNRAVTLNPGILNINQSQDQQKIIPKIQESTEYQNFVKARIKDAEDAGQTEINFSGGIGTKDKDKTIVFNQGGDLQYSFQKITNTYITGTKNKDGKWEINVKFYDVYDFDAKAYPNNGNFIQKGVNVGVRLADQSQKTNVISNYAINVEFNDNQF